MTAAESTNGSESGFVTRLRRVLLAGVGAVVLAQEEIEEFVDRLVKKGEVAEKDGRRLLSEVVARRKREVMGLESDLTTRLEKLLHKMNLASNSDIEAIDKRIEELARKVEKITAARRST